MAVQNNNPFRVQFTGFKMKKKCNIVIVNC